MLQTNERQTTTANQPCHSRLPSVTNGYSSAYVPIDLRRNQRQRLRSRSRPLEFKSGRVLYQHQSPPTKMGATSERLVSIPHLKLRCQCHLPYGRKFTRKPCLTLIFICQRHQKRRIPYSSGFANLKNPLKLRSKLG